MSQKKLKVIMGTFFLIAGVVLVYLASLGCTETIPDAPSGLVRTNTYPCSISWTDNSDNETGFRIYIGYNGCVSECDTVTTWNLSETVGENVTSYQWTPSCCSVAECSCVMVVAYNSAGESGQSNAVQLAPLCK